MAASGPGSMMEASGLVLENLVVGQSLGQEKGV